MLWFKNYYSIIHTFFFFPLLGVSQSESLDSESEARGLAFVDFGGGGDNDSSALLVFFFFDRAKSS